MYLNVKVSMKAYVMVFSIYSGFLCASDNRLVSSQNWGIPNYNQSRSTTIEFRGVNSSNVPTRESNWVECFKMNPQDYYNLNPGSFGELFYKLKIKNPLLNEEEYHAGREEILKYYITQLRGFEEEHSCSPIEEGVGSSVVPLLTGIQSIAEYYFIRRAAKQHHYILETEEEELWTAYSMVLFSTATLTLVGGSSIVAHCQSKFLKRKLYEQGDRNMIAMYKVVKRLGGKHRIGW